jgi:hypothetical protein
MKRVIKKSRYDLIYNWMTENDVSVAEILDVSVDCSSIVGVGLISLSDRIAEHIKSYVKDPLKIDFDD